MISNFDKLGYIKFYYFIIELFYLSYLKNIFFISDELHCRDRNWAQS